MSAHVGDRPAYARRVVSSDARASIGMRLRAAVTRAADWWRGLEPPERVLYRAMGLLAIGCGLVEPALAFIVPGALLALVFFGFSFRRASDG